MRKLFSDHIVHRFIALITALILNIIPSWAQDRIDFSQMDDSLTRLSHIVLNDLKPEVYIKLSNLYIDSNLIKSDSFAKLALNLAIYNNNEADITKSSFQLGKVNFEKDSIKLAKENFNTIIHNTSNELQLSKTFKQIRSLSCFYLAKICLKNNGSIREVIKLTKGSIRLAEMTNDTELLGELHNFLGVQYYNINMDKKGFEEINESIAIYKETEDIKKLAETYGLLSSYAKNNKTLEYIHKAIALYAKAGDSLKMATYMINMAYACSSVLGDEKTEKYYKMAYNIFKRHNNIKGQAYSLFILSGFYMNSNRLKESYILCLQNIKYCKENQQFLYLAHSLKNMATFHNMYGERDSAYYYFSILDTVSQKLESKIPRIRYLCGLANRLMQDNNLYKAEQLLNEALKLTQLSRKNSIFKRKVFLYLSMIYKRKGNYKEELKYYRLSHHEEDSVYNHTKAIAYTNEQLKYELNSMENKLNVLKKDEEIINAQIKRSREFIHIFIFGILLLGLFIISIIYQYRDTKSAYNDLMKKNLILLDYNEATFLKNKHSEINPNSFKQIKSKIEEYIIENKAFLYPEISLDFAAKKIKSNASYLSKVINQAYDSNFTNFINVLRIKESQKLMGQTKYQNHTIESIAKEVGFKNKSVFNSAFKKYTGLTPSYYLNFLQNKSDFTQ